MSGRGGFGWHWTAGNSKHFCFDHPRSRVTVASRNTLVGLDTTGIHWGSTRQACWVGSSAGFSALQGTLSARGGHSRDMRDFGEWVGRVRAG